MSGWNFGDLLDVTAANVPPERPALIQGARVISWNEFDARTNRLARALLAAGLETGDRVAILSRNAPEFIEIAAACFKARLTHVNVNYRYTTAEIGYVLADCGAAALFHQAEFIEVTEPLAAASPALLRVVVGGPGDTYAAMAAEGDGSPLGLVRSPDDGYLLYTGGTTGRPKGVMWRSDDARRVQLEAPTIPRPIATMAEHAAAVAGNASPGRCIPACPLMHGAGLNSAMAELLGGGTAILLSSVRFDPVELWEEAARLRATRILVVGDAFARPMLETLRANPGRWDLGALRTISSAGLMWSREVKQGLVELLPQVVLVDILGASEASGFGYAVTTAERETPTGRFDAGRATVLIDPQTERVLAPDEAGEGWLARRAPFATGYHGDPAKSATVFRTVAGERYAIPGDMAERDAAGRLRLLGRGNMCVNSGGEKIFIEEVEEALKRAPGVRDAMVVGVPDPRLGSALAALVTVDAPVEDAAILAALAGELAGYKRPRRLIRLDELPRHASGKGDYRRAREIAEREGGSAPAHA